jgi:hypothetical protein
MRRAKRPTYWRLDPRGLTLHELVSSAPAPMRSEAVVRSRLGYTLLTLVLGISLLSPATAYARPAPVHANAHSGASADQCTLPLSQRVGAWWCLNSVGGADTASTSRMVTPKVLPGPDPGGWCYLNATASGCYYPSNNNTTMKASATGFYGYGSTFLGDVTYTVQWQLNGHMLSKLQGSLSTTGTVEVVYYEASFQRALSNSDGASTTTLFTTQSPTDPLLPGGGTFTWAKPNPQWVDTRYANYVAEISPSWEVAGYPGYWWINVKSPIWHCASSTSPCYFTTNLPALAVQGGYS